MDQSFVPRTSNSWVWLNQDSSRPFSWERPTTYDANQLADDSQPMRNSLSAYVPTHSHSLLPSSHMPHDEPSLHDFEHNYNDGQQPRPPLQTHQEPMASILNTCDLPIHPQRPYPETQSYQSSRSGVTQAAAGLPYTPLQASDQMVRQSHYMVDGNQQRIAHQQLAPPLLPNSNNHGDWNPIAEFMLDGEGYTPGFSPSRSAAKLVLPVTSQETNETPTADRLHRCPHCEKTHKTKNLLKCVPPFSLVYVLFVSCFCFFH